MHPDEASLALILARELPVYGRSRTGIRIGHRIGDEPPDGLIVIVVAQGQPTRAHGIVAASGDHLHNRWESHVGCRAGRGMN